MVSDGQAFSAELEAFLLVRIESYEELETLLLLRREPQASWSPDAVGARLNVDRERALETLVHLADARLLRVRHSAPDHPYCYDPADPADDRIVEQLEQAMKNRRLDLIKLMNANAMTRMRTRAIRAFADAFLIPKRDDDDKQDNGGG
jgi:hypothetical protein